MINLEAYLRASLVRGEDTHTVRVVMGEDGNPRLSITPMLPYGVLASSCVLFRVEANALETLATVEYPPPPAEPAPFTVREVYLNRWKPYEQDGNGIEITGP